MACDSNKYQWPRSLRKLAQRCSKLSLEHVRIADSCGEPATLRLQRNSATRWRGATLCGAGWDKNFERYGA